MPPRNCSASRPPRPTAGGRTLGPGCGSRSAKENSADRGALHPKMAHGCMQGEPSLRDTPAQRHTRCLGDPPMTEAQIFAAMLEKTGAQARAAYLTEACAGDEKMRRRIEALLRAHAEPDALLDRGEPKGGT